MIGQFRTHASSTGGRVDWSKFSRLKEKFPAHVATMILLPYGDCWNGTKMLKMDLPFMGPCIADIFASVPYKMQRYTIYLFLWIALHVLGGTSAHHQELRTLYTASGTCQTFTAACRNRQQFWQVPDALYTVLSSWWWAEVPPKTCRAIHRNK
jgi:hypothetical protein